MFKKRALLVKFVLLVGLEVAADVSGNWTAVQRGINIPLDLENTPLEIKTNSALGSEDVVDVSFYTSQGKYAGAVRISFSSTPRYWLSTCSSRNRFPSNLPTQDERTWRITLDKTAGIRVKIHCNGVEVVNYPLPDNCKSIWSREIKDIFFYEYDDASDYFRAGQR
ncbi:hypothetical protein ACHWQZ_G018026, partial [Mnemiopsis leidyi]